MSTSGRVSVRLAIALSLIPAVCIVAGLIVVQSQWFRDRVRERIISELTRASGGRVELGSFNFDWSHMTATVAPLVLHGAEPAGDPPFLRVRSITLGLRVISVLERQIDLLSLRGDQPVVHIAIYADGSNNIPVPPHHSTTWAEDLFKIKVGRYEAVDGMVEYGDRRFPIDFRGENLNLQASYERRAPRYRGNVSTRRLTVTAPGIGLIAFDGSTAFTVDRSKIEFSGGRFTARQSRFEVAGVLEDFLAPRGNFTVKANIPIRDAVAQFHLPLEPVGVAAFDGRVAIAFKQPPDYTVSGRLSARGVKYTLDRLKVDGAEIRGDVRAVPQNIAFSGVTASALGSTIKGRMDLTNGENLHLQAQVDGLDLPKTADIFTERAFPWGGTLVGDVTLDAILGKPATKLDMHAGITPSGQGVPMQGQLDLEYDQAAGEIHLTDSYVATPATRLDLAGTLGETLQVQLRSSNLDDLLPVLRLSGETALKESPLKLANGSATFNGRVIGPIADPHFTGQLAVTKARLEGHAFDRFTGDVDATRRAVRLERAVLARGVTQVEGSAGITENNGQFEDGAIAAQLSVRNAMLGELAQEAGLTEPIAGTAAGTIRLSGTVHKPQAEIQVQVDHPAAFGEQPDRARANLRYSPTEVQVSMGEADTGTGKLLFAGTYRHPETGWENGDLRFELAAQRMPISGSRTLSKLQPQLDGTIDGKVNGSGRLVKKEFELLSIDGTGSTRNVTWNREPVGDVSTTAETHGAELTVRANAQAHGAMVQGQGSWNLAGDGPGSATVRFSRVSVATLHELAMIAAAPEERSAAPPFEGFVDGGATFSVALRKPQDFHGELTLDTVQIDPKPAQGPRLGVQAQDLVVKNAKPVVIALSSQEARIRSAEFTARETSLDVSGVIPFRSPSPASSPGRSGADLAVHGSVNLVILQLLSPDLLARGNATVEASIRGSLANPQLNGRMELKRASLYLNDVPNGVDNANGVILFDRNRATIDRLTAETGGGTVTFGGFVEFSSVLVYRLQARAQSIRLRYQDVSVTMSGQLALNGTSDASTVSGLKTLNRASVDPRADLGQLMATFAKPSAAPSSNDYLRGMQFDVHIQSEPNFQFQTSLTRDVETEVDLRLRGTPQRTALLGSISVDQGEIELFGNRYTIDRGQISFLSPVKIEPSFDLNLETRVRGITVNVAIAGTMQRLNVNYSSDPPLQSREIVALLAVGRTPSESAGLTAPQDTSGSSSFAEAGGGVLSEAVTEQLSGRLQRFFGASRVKIDPTVTGIDYLPAARLTLQQQVSHDVTLTYITNLNRTEEQIVQVEWDFSQHWSAVAVREANGLFGVDIQYKKRFK